MIARKLKIMARRENFDFGIAITLADRPDSKTLNVASPLTFCEHTNGMIAEPTMRLKIEEAQLLIDELWNCGLRPTEGTGSAGSLKATQNHLEDMRTIVFNKLLSGG